MDTDHQDAKGASVKRSITAIISFCLGMGAACAGESMSVDRLQGIVSDMAAESRVEGRAMRFRFDGQRMLLLTDPNQDRMRIMTPIAETADLDDDQLRRCMEANFSSAVDARYAIRDGVLYSAYIHPLSPLTEDQIRSAVPQVATLAATFGSGYHSGELRFQ